MENKIYKPRIDKIYFLIVVPTSLFLIGVTVALAVEYPPSLFFMIPIMLLTAYFFVTPLYGYVELRQSGVFIRFGFILTREISYDRIRGVVKERKLYADSEVSLKCSLDHVNIKYNTFDIVSVSVTDNDGLIAQIEQIAAAARR